jgi:hypothetical protein
VGRAGPGNWAKRNPGNGWVDLGPKRLSRSRPKTVGPILAQHIFFLLLFWAGPDPAKHLGWAITGPAQVRDELIAESEQ